LYYIHAFWRASAAGSMNIVQHFSAKPEEAPLSAVHITLHHTIFYR
jgi:hypothetical protein